MKPNSLVSRVYKAKYVPNVTFLDAQLGDNPSFIWRSIWEVKFVIVVGARWKIGAGNTINILGQPWLKDEANPYITSYTPEIQQSKVSSLLNMDSKQPGMRTSLVICLMLEIIIVFIKSL